MQQNNIYVLHLARTGLVTAPCSTISHLRSDGSTLYTTPSLDPMHRCGMQWGPYLWTKLLVVQSSMFDPRSRIKSSLASFPFSIKRLGNS